MTSNVIDKITHAETLEYVLAFHVNAPVGYTLL